MTKHFKRKVLLVVDAVFYDAKSVVSTSSALSSCGSDFVNLSEVLKVKCAPIWCYLVF